MMLSFLLLSDTTTAITDAQKTINDKHQAYVLALFGLAGSLMPVILSWLKDRGVDSQRSKQLDEGVKRIAFWEQWLKLSTSLGEGAADVARQRVQHEMDLLCTALSSSSALIHSEASALKELKAEFTSKLSGLSWFQRVLLFYKPPRAIAWLPRFFFYVFLLLTVLATVITIIFGKDGLDVIGDEIAFIVFTVVATIAFRYISVYIEKPRKGTSEVAAALPTLPTS